MLSRAQTPTGTHHARFRTNLPKEKDRKKFPTIMVVRWKFPISVGTGAPVPAVLASMDQFEDRIMTVSNEERDWGALAVVLTVGSIREWRFFAPNDKIFIDGFNKALEGYGPYPLTVEAFQDPDWNGLKDFQKGASN
jgi:hypothetical protein